MAYTGLTQQQRTLIEDAVEALRNSFADEYADDDDTTEDTHLRAVEILTVMLGVLDTDRDERVIALRWPDRDGGPVPWRRIEGPAGLGRNAPQSRWSRVVDARAASADQSFYTPAASAAVAV